MTLLTALLPIRDHRERTVGYELSTAPPAESDTAMAADGHARESLELAPLFSRLSNAPLIVPVTPAILRDGFLARFPGMDVTLMIATEALEEPQTRRAAERAIAAGIRIALDGYPTGGPLPAALSGTIVAIDRRTVSNGQLASRIRSLIDAGVRPLVRGIDDRASRLHAISHGASLVTGALLPRGAAIRIDDTAAASIVRTINLFAALAGGELHDRMLDEQIENDELMSAMLLRSVSSAAIGVRNTRSVQHAMSVLGRDAAAQALAIGACRIFGELMQDPGFAATALRRVYFFEETGARADPAPHPRARTAAALLSLAEYAFNEPPGILAASHFSESPDIVRDILLDRIVSLRQIRELATAIDCGWWADARALCHDTGLSVTVVAGAYESAWRRAREGMTRLQ